MWNKFDATKTMINWLDFIVKPLVWYSIIMLVIELEMGTYNSREGHWFFLFSERAVAGIMTLEYLFRFWRNSGRNYYPLTPFGLIDLLAVLPFWIGFAVPAEWLHSIRTLRVLRLLKFFRYSRSLQLVALGFYKAWFRVRSLLFMMFIICLFTVTALYEIEGSVQESFKGLFDCSWFVAVTGTTVGYGDVSPQTMAGKIIVMIFMVSGLSIFAAVFGAICGAFEDVFSEEDNPNIDPLLEFHKVWEKNKKLDKIDKDTGTAEVEDAAKEAEV